jgi:two-component system sensor kinase FixL
LSGIITDWNRGAEFIFGYTAGEVIGQPISVLLPPDHEDETVNILDKIKRGERVEHYETRRRRKDGTIIDVSITVSPVWDDAGKLFAASKVARDVTASKQSQAVLLERATVQQQLHDLQAELVHMSRFTAMGEMASTLAHELNQPLTAVAGYLRGIRRLLGAPGTLDMALLCDAADRAAEQTLRAGQIIRRLREFVARGESERQAEGLAKLIEEARTLALIGVKETGVLTELLLAPEKIFVLVDKIQIQQVILNLVRNAIEAMQDMPVRRLTISMSRAGDDIAEVAVADTGPGISPEIAAKLFQPFNTTKPQGMGLGLSISRTIIEAHNGQLWAEPNAGGGTVFRFTLKILGPQELADES